jgi:hypothetical protein
MTRILYYSHHHPQTPHQIRRRRRPRQRAAARRLLTIDHALLVTVGAMLVVLTLSLAVGMAKGQLGHDQRQFTAYDCTSPKELRAVTKAKPPQCQDRLDQDPVSQRNQTFLLLQKATYRRQPVSRCKVLRTRVAHHCGDSDHQTFIPQFSTFREEVTIMANQCKDMYSQKVYKDHWHKATPINIGMTNVIRKELVGSTNPYGGGDTHVSGQSTSRMDWTSRTSCSGRSCSSPWTRIPYWWTPKEPALSTTIR